MMSTINFWLLVGVIGAGTLALRAAFVFAFAERQLPPQAERALYLAPAAIFSAIVLPAVFGTATSGSGLDPRLLAAGIAVLIAWRSRSMLMTIAGGMMALWLGRWLLG